MATNFLTIHCKRYQVVVLMVPFEPRRPLPFIEINPDCEFNIIIYFRLVNFYFRFLLFSFKII